MSKNITLRPEQIDELAEGIRNSVSQLTDIERILRETEGDLTLAKALKEQADVVSYVFLISNITVLDLYEKMWEVI